MLWLNWLLDRFEPPLQNIEGEYRKYYLQADTVQVIIVCLMVFVTAFVFIPSDYLLFQQSRMFYALLVTRITFGISTLLFIDILRRVTEPNRYDQLILAWMIATLLFSIWVDSTRPATYLGRFLFHVTYVFLIYLALPIPLIFRGSAALVYSAVSVANLLVVTAEAATLFIIATVFVLIIANLVGFITSTRIYTYRRRQFGAIREADRLNAQLTVLAETDPLTGVLNRRKLFELAAEEFTRFARYHRPFSVVLMDLDLFKRVNDTYGHSVGDQVLVLFAEIALSEKRGTDKFGRLGGEEFALLLPETSDVLAAHIGERIRRHLQESNRIVALVGYPITISVGTAIATREDTGFDDVLRRADQALYRAKNTGRNRVER